MPENITVTNDGYLFTITLGQVYAVLQFDENTTKEEVIKKVGNACSAAYQCNYLFEIVNGKIK